MFVAGLGLLWMKKKMDGSDQMLTERHYGKISEIGYRVASVRKLWTAKGPASLSLNSPATFDIASASVSGLSADDIWASIRARRREA
jgi:hypothetical protein